MALVSIMWTVWLAVLCYSFEYTVALPSTVIVEEGGTQCFYQDVREAADTGVSIFVLKGGALDIGLLIQGPLPEDFNLEYPKPNPEAQVLFDEEVAHQGGESSDAGGISAFNYQIEKAKGLYKVCLMNDRRVEKDTKHVMLEISQGGTKGSLKQDSIDPQDDSNMGIINRQVHQLREYFEDIKNKQLSEQRLWAVREQQASSNQANMMTLSILETVVLLVVSIGQILFVRHWFEGKGTILKQHR